MADVPREAVEFARLLVRAFYPPDFIVIMDAILRQNNYIAHHDLARRLGMQPKELRQILVRMEVSRLMRSERRQQKRINFRDERRPTRTVNTEFWYVPLPELIDAFIYRVHIMTKSIQNKRTNEIQRRKYICSLCKAEYQLIDILSSMNSAGEFLCSRMGVRIDRRPLPCGGIIKEQDNISEIKETERVKQLLDEQLRELRERALHCSTMEIPSHPLEGADEKTWGERVPETVGVNGERVDDDGLSSSMKGEGDVTKNGEPASTGLPMYLPEASPEDHAPIPEKPTWFKEAQGDDEEEWVDTQNHVLESTTGTAAGFAQKEDDKNYYEQYLQEIAGVKPGNTEERAKSAIDIIRLDEESEPTTGDAVEPIEVADENADVIISVGGKMMQFSQVTEEMTEDMTHEEYTAYHKLANQKTTGNLEDEDDEYE